MALTEIQLPNLPDEKWKFYRMLQDVAGQISSDLHNWKQIAAFINRMDAADLDTLTIPAGQIRTDLVNFKTVLNMFVSIWNNQPVTPSVNPQTVVDTIRRMNQ